MNIQNAKTNENYLTKTALIITVIWIAIQTALIAYFWEAPQGSDMGEYIKIAKECFSNGQWYPYSKHVYSAYIWAPGFINFLILQLHLFGTVNLNSIFNLLMNIGILYEIYFLGKKLFSRKVGLIAVILSCLIYSNAMVILPAGTEIPFLFLSLTGLCLILVPGYKYLPLIFAGILFAIANWIRPLVIVFTIAALIYMFMKKRNALSYLSLLLPMIITAVIIGSITYHKTGYFVYQSTTSGVNLIMTANDKAYGGVMSHVFKDSTSTMYIKNVQQLTFIERDSIYKARAIEWIKKNPVKFSSLYIKKIAGLYIEDSWADRPLLGGDGFIGKYATGEISRKEFITRAVHMILGSLMYYAVLILFGISMWINRKRIWGRENIIILLVLILGTGITCLFSVSPRYHYPFMFSIIIYAAWGIQTMANRGLFTKDKH